MPSDQPRDLERTALYLRKSRADLDAEARGEGETLSKHRRALLEFAQKNRLNIVAIREEVVSGEKISDRPEMKLLLQEVEAGFYDGVLCMDLDRLGRGDMIDQGTILAAFRNSETLIITPRKVYDLSDELDEEWSEFEAFMARRELKIITRRLQRGRVQAVKEGKYIGTRPPYGYDKGPDGILIIKNDEAEIVRLIYFWYVNGDNGERLGSRKIAQKLNSLGVKSPTGKSWEASTIRAMLKNEVYIGRVQWKKHARNKSQHYNRLRPREQWIDAPGKHEPLIDIETFKTAQRLLQGKSVVPGGLPMTNPLAGLIVCGVCGAKMVLKPQKYDKGDYRKMIVCPQACGNKSSTFRHVEDKLLEALDKEIQRFETEQQRLEKKLKRAGSPITIPFHVITELEADIDVLNQQLTTIHASYEQGVYDVATFLQRKNAVNLEIENKKKALESARSEIAAAEKRNNDRKYILPAARRVIEDYHKSKNIADKNRLLKTLIDQVKYTKDRSAKYDNFTLEIYTHL